MKTIEWIIPLVQALLVIQFIRSDLRTHHHRSLVYKGIASLFFVLVALLRAIPFSPEKGWIIAGLLCGMIGDILLAIRYLYHGKTKLKFLYAGTISFAMGHFIYMCFCFTTGLHIPLMIISFLLMSVVITYYFHRRFIMHDKKDRMVGIIYLMIVAMMTSCAIAMCVKQGMNHASVLFTSGACLFLAADTITVYKNLSKRRVLSVRVLNLVLYYTSQVLIALSVWYL